MKIYKYIEMHVEKYLLCVLERGWQKIMMGQIPFVFQLLESL